MQIVKTKLADSKSIREYSKIGLIGGEFFQGQLGNENSAVRYEFNSLIQLCDIKLTNGIIKNVWICASLLIGKQWDLWETLDIFRKSGNLYLWN